MYCIFNKCNQKMLELNNSKYFAGIMMLVLNLGSRFLVMELSQNQEQILSNQIIRRFVLFSVIFAATKDIWVSLILTAVFIVLVTGLFHEDSDYCLISKVKYSKQIPKTDYEKAQEIIKMYEIQQNKFNKKK